MQSIDLNTAFRNALNAFLELEGRGAKVKLSKKTGISQPYITQISKGDRYGDEIIKRKIAEFYGYKYEEFLDIGRGKAEIEKRPVNIWQLVSDKNSDVYTRRIQETIKAKQAHPEFDEFTDKYYFKIWQGASDDSLNAFKAVMRSLAETVDTVKAEKRKRLKKPLGA